MRIVAGAWRGRTIAVPHSDAIRPTQDRVREALFNLLRPVLGGARFLDLFAGSGAVGLEALSQGAAEADFIERDRAVHATLLRNLAAFGVDATRARLDDVADWLASPTRPPRGPWDIVFADPPYRLAGTFAGAPLAEALLARGAFAPGAFLILESDVGNPADPIPRFALLRDRRYGKTRLALHRLTD